MREEALLEEMLYVLMNQIALEEHMIESYMKTGNKVFLEISDEQRRLRQRTLSILKQCEKVEKEVRSSKGELWCSIKHSLSIKMHIMESIQKCIRMGKLKEADELRKILIEQDKEIMVLWEMYLGDNDGSI